MICTLQRYILYVDYNTYAHNYYIALIHHL